jgi:hypothetical protein
MALPTADLPSLLLQQKQSQAAKLLHTTLTGTSSGKATPLSITYIRIAACLQGSYASPCAYHTLQSFLKDKAARCKPSTAGHVKLAWQGYSHCTLQL